MQSRATLERAYVGARHAFGARSGARITLALLLAIALGQIALAGAARAGGGHRGHPGGGPPHERGDKMTRFLDRHADELGLDEATRERIDALVTASQERAEELDAARRDAHDTLRALLDAEPVDRAAVMQQVEVIGALDLEQSKLRMATMIDVQAQLTPEQRAEMRALMERRFADRHRETFDACGAELAGVCADAGPGPDRIRCLFEHDGELSDACAEALPRRGGMHRGHPRHGHGKHGEACEHGEACTCGGRHGHHHGKDDTDSSDAE